MPTDIATTLGHMGESGLLARLLEVFPASSRDVVGPGDDAAVISLGGRDRAVVTTDSMVRGRDWLDDWSTAQDVAVKCLTQNFADVAAMGAVPTSLLLSFVADPETPVQWVEDFAATMGAEAAACGVSVVGGDLSSAPPGVVVLGITAIGDLEGREPVLRSGARVGDVVAVSDGLGRSAAGLWLLGSDSAESNPAAADLVAMHVRPRADHRSGPIAADAGATAMIDVSDGLLRDVDLVARASGVAIDLAEDGLAPFVEALAQVVGAEVARECVLAGGEEHTLVATFPSAAAVPPGWTGIGAVREGEGILLDGTPTTPQGWDHFAG